MSVVLITLYFLKLLASNAPPLNLLFGHKTKKLLPYNGLPRLKNRHLNEYPFVESKLDLQLAYKFDNFILSYDKPFENLPELPTRFRGIQFERPCPSDCEIRKQLGQQIEKNDLYRRVLVVNTAS